MMNPSYPAGSGDSSGPGPAPGGGRYRRRYLGSQVLAASGTWTKASALEQPFFGGIDPVDVEVDLECVGGGGAGPYGTDGARTSGLGSRPRWLRGVAFADLPESAAVVVGAGGPSNGASGGTTSFGSLLSAIGGAGGRQQGYDFYPELLESHLDGPGHGGCGTPFGFSGATDSYVSRPDLRRAGGAGPGAELPACDGQSALTPFQYGAGGGVAAVNPGSGTRGGAGGWPGGGGGATYSASYLGGPGGGGAARPHYYVWEPVP